MTDLPLGGKKILFFCPQFFGYEISIKQELEKLGAQVFFRSGQALEHSWAKGLLRLAPSFGWKLADYYYLKWLKKDAPDQCDIVFIIKGEAISPQFLKTLRSKYNNAKVIFYMFDSVKNYKKINLKFDLIDEFYSFDLNDCRMMNYFTYRPLFFLDKYLSSSVPKVGSSTFFIGTLNGDRPKVISRLIDVLGNDSIFDYWLFVRSKVELRIRKLLDVSLKKIDTLRLLYKPMHHEDIKKHFDDCCAVLDIEHPNQTGLTMRTFEVLASGKKLITTNSSIIEHDFYDPTRICVIDRENPNIPLDFFTSVPAPIPDLFFEKYSLRGWVLDIFKHEVMPCCNHGNVK